MILHIHSNFLNVIRLKRDFLFLKRDLFRAFQDPLTTQHPTLITFRHNRAVPKKQNAELVKQHAD